VETGFVCDVDLLAVSDLLVRMVRAEKIEQKVQLNLHVLRDGRFLNLKSGMVMAFEVYRPAIDMKVHRLEVVRRMNVMMMFGAFRRVEIGFHMVYLPIAKLTRSC
jgi:hypothetical protein